MNYIIGEADRIHVKGEYYNGEKLLRCSNCGQRGISTFDMHCSGCGFLLNRIDSIDGDIRITHTPPIIEVDELPEFTNCIEINCASESEEYSEIKNEVKNLSKRVETLENQMKKDKEEQFNKLKAELDYAKICSALQKYADKSEKDVFDKMSGDVISRKAVLEKAISVPIAKVVTEDEVICRKVVFVDDIEKLPPVIPGHCKDCKYFEYDYVANVDGIPLIVAHEFCKRWGDGCKTKEDGYCFLYEPRESEGL